MNDTGKNSKGLSLCENMERFTRLDSALEAWQLQQTAQWSQASRSAAFLRAWVQGATALSLAAGLGDATCMLHAGDTAQNTMSR